MKTVKTIKIAYTANKYMTRPLFSVEPKIAGKTAAPYAAMAEVQPRTSSGGLWALLECRGRGGHCEGVWDVSDNV